MTTKMTIDYDTIMQGLEKAVEERKEAAAWTMAKGPTLLKEFCTIGVIVPRQCGRTYTALKRLVANERSMLIVPNGSIRDAMACNYHHHCGDELNAYAKSRIYTYGNIASAIAKVEDGQQDVLCANATEIIVDDALYFFEHIRRNKFYKWLHKRGGDDQLIVLLS